MFGLSWAKLVMYLVLAVAIAGASAFATHHWDQNAYLALQLKDANAATAVAEAQATAMAEQAATTQAEAKLASDAALREAQAQVKIVEKTHETVTEIPEFISPVAIQHSCIPVGFLRVIDARILGVEPGTLPLAPGYTDDSCSPIDPDVLAERLLALIGPAQQNAEQLNALEAAIIDSVNTYNKDISK